MKRIALILAMVLPLVALGVFIKCRPGIVHAKNSMRMLNAFTTDEQLWKWGQFQGLEKMKDHTVAADPKVTRTYQNYQSEFATWQKSGEVAVIDPKVDLTFVDFYSAATNRFMWHLVKAQGPYAIADTQYFMKVRTPDGHEYFMKEYDIADPRPHVPGEPGQ